MVAIITVFALGFEPFVQQSLRSPLRKTSIGNVTPILRATTAVSYAGDATANHSIVFNGLLLQALYSNTVAPFQPPCSESSCEWPRYWTAAVCSSCEDILNETTISSSDNQVWHDLVTGDWLDDFQGVNDISEEVRWNYSAQTVYSLSLGKAPPFTFVANLTNGLWVPSGLVSSELDYPSEILFDASNRPALVDCGHSCALQPNMTGPLNTLGHVRLNRSDDGVGLAVTSAMKCSISLCAREQSSTVINGSFSTQIRDDSWGLYSSLRPGDGDEWGYTWTAQLGQHNFSTINAHIYGVEPIVHLLDSVINGLVGNSLQSLTLWPTWQEELHPYTTNFSSLNPPPNTMQFMSDMRNSSARIAQAFTNYLHQNGNKDIPGQAYATVPFVDVRWPWLAFPLAIVLICFTALLTTIYETRRHGLPTWKTSSYPLLFGYQYQDQNIPMTQRRQGQNVSTDVDAARTQVEDGRTASRDPDEDEANEEHDQMHETAMARPIVKGDLVSNYHTLAKETSVRLTRRDGHWMFDSE